MESQSNLFPQICQYDQQSVAVPISIAEIERDGENLYQFDMRIVDVDGPVDPTQLDCVKKYLKSAIKDIHDETIQKGCPLSFGFRVDCAPLNITDWSAALQLLQLSGETEIEVCDYDNVTHTLSSAQYAQMCGEVGVYLQGLRSIKWTLRKAIDDAADIDAAYGVAVWPTS